MEQFVNELENCETGDERCAIVEDYLGEFQVALTKDPLWSREYLLLKLGNKSCQLHIAR